MKNNILTGLLYLFMVLSFSANASATLEWGSVPSSSRDVQIQASNASASSIQGVATFNENLSKGFSHEWNFSVDPTATVTLGIVNLFAGQTQNAQVRLDGTLLTKSSFNVTHGEISYWDFSNLLSTGNHTLSLSAASISLISGFGLYNINLAATQLTASPIPAAVWLFGSALLGISGLASRRKTISTEIN